MKNSIHNSQIEEIKALFSKSPDPQEKYKTIIELGRNLPDMPARLQTEENRVLGCQSTLYLHSYLEDDRLYFFVSSDALISKGLAAILTLSYQGLALEEMLKSPPNFIKDLDILSSISFNRSNGFANIYQKMKNQALSLLLSKHSR